MKKQQNWWDKLGEPQYGDELVIRSSGNITNFDPYFVEGLTTIQSAWMERPIADDWMIDPKEWDYRMHFRFDPYVKGHLAESCEFPDSTTWVIHLRKGIHWQDIPPVNGREFIADDVAYHYHRLFGLGSGFTAPSPYHANVVTAYRDLISVTATDRYTVVFKWKTPYLEPMRETLQAPTNAACLEAREAVEKWGDVADWHHAIGTGPFILKDFVDNVSATLIRNPNYWGHDERHPQNQLPYIDRLKFKIILDDDDALQAMARGEVDVMDGLTYHQYLQLKKLNPDILWLAIPASGAETIAPRNDVKPFTDLRVRTAMQMALDLPAIAKNYYAQEMDLLDLNYLRDLSHIEFANKIPDPLEFLSPGLWPTSAGAGATLSVTGRGDYKLKALGPMKRTVDTLSTEVEKAKRYLDRTRTENARAALGGASDGVSL